MARGRLRAGRAEPEHRDGVLAAVQAVPGEPAVERAATVRAAEQEEPDGQRQPVSADDRVSEHGRPARACAGAKPVAAASCYQDGCHGGAAGLRREQPVEPGADHPRDADVGHHRAEGAEAFGGGRVGYECPGDRSYTVCRVVT